MAAFDPNQYKNIEEKADKLTDKLKASSFTALILISLALVGFALLIL